MDTSLSVWGIAGAIRNRRRSKLHWQRKLYHCAMGTFCFLLYAFVLTRQQAFLILGGVGGFLLLCDFLRFYITPLNNWALAVFGNVMRREELKSLSSNSYYILGLLALVVFFKKPVALISLLLLAYGDPAASLVGTWIGKIKLVGKRTLEGALANFLVSTTVVFMASLWVLHLPLSRASLVALLSAVIGVIVELIPLPWDDNFTLPVGSALLLTGLLPFL